MYTGELIVKPLKAATTLKATNLHKADQRCSFLSNISEENESETDSNISHTDHISNNLKKVSLHVLIFKNKVSEHVVLKYKKVSLHVLILKKKVSEHVILKYKKVSLHVFI